MQNTHILDELAGGLLDIVNFLNAPQRDEALLRAAGVELDRALFPLLARLGMQGPLGVAELAEQVGRDYTTVSRQLARLDSLGLVTRSPDNEDRRRSIAEITEEGNARFRAVREARRRALTQVLAAWTDEDRQSLTLLVRRFADGLGQQPLAERDKGVVEPKAL
ncbi:MarR family transcriptional regulator [Rhizobium lusitanum]|uniref:DNA-binding MarR family transcriptional regulator n=1 Tax=Rhizobium lusitanum TaxID=293958 RepID=A0A7X0ISJ8_9HYPH|nr:MarR family transcriptional regulator [Rhizobium lusitanum]MBB6486371.1 DNA-binding MarR family transcriptional regulator [Rhizobium lusitanum]